MKLPILSLVIVLMIGLVSAVPYSINFDVRNMTGFSDNVINAGDVVAYIHDKNPSSPMLNEENIGKNFINYGKTNNVNPSFLIATAQLEGQFGTAGWAKTHLQCHNSFGYGVPSGSALPNNKTNCAESHAVMIERVSNSIAYGTHYYQSDKYTVDQIRRIYAGEPNSQSIVNNMNSLYTFAQNRHTNNLFKLINFITGKTFYWVY